MTIHMRCSGSTSMRFAGWVTSIPTVLADVPTRGRYRTQGARARRPPVLPKRAGRALRDPLLGSSRRCPRCGPSRSTSARRVGGAAVVGRRVWGPRACHSRYARTVGALCDGRGRSMWSRGGSNFPGSSLCVGGRRGVLGRGLACPLGFRAPFGRGALALGTRMPCGSSTELCSGCGPSDG